jgi:hypothetical protein
MERSLIALPSSWNAGFNVSSKRHRPPGSHQLAQINGHAVHECAGDDREVPTVLNLTSRETRTMLQLNNLVQFARDVYFSESIV